MSSNYREQWTSVGGHFPSHWQFFKLEELLENTKGIAVGVMYPGDHTAEGIPLIKVGDVKDGYIASQPSFFISPEVDEEYKRTRLNGTELLITLVGNPGDCVVVEPYMAGWNAARALAVVRLKDTGLREWLKYILLSKPAKHLIDARLNTTVQKTLNLKDIRELGIPIPPKHERDMIIKNISAIEQKKIVNSDTNQTLEQMAQALFKSWFVDFEPVKAKIAVLEAGGSQEDATLAAMTAISGKDADALAVFEREHPEQYAELKATAELFPSAMKNSEVGAIPEGWNIGKLGDIIEFNPKRVLKKGNIAPYLDMKNVPITGHSAQEIIDREFSSGSKFRNGDTLLARITPCLENGKTAFVDFLLTDEMIGWGSTEFIIMRSKQSLPLSLSYFLARLDYFRTIAIQSMQGTSGRQRADASVLEQHIWVVPPNEILKKFGIFSDSVLNCNRARNAENNALTQLRDTVLPKLLSGEITLPEAEQIISEEA
ncbi:restriction endonuclease subunit S [Salmonella enterica subsp. enterica serovar Bere]|nr:restriction endonuclease subunit S [Salmonella enterica subsp. enterica serovar Bere]ECE1001593.1 restriction endonuclease subunit S [Salmonella enterica subsp. enterica serovar Bere]EDT7273695.1 restriction endonuclease subunit S [Salmonella enterica subsp. enterica serovar Bere]